MSVMLSSRFSKKEILFFSFSFSFFLRSIVEGEWLIRNRGGDF